MNRVLKSGVKFANSNICRCSPVSGIRNCTTAAPSTGSEVQDVSGLSKNVVDVPSGQVGFPGASKTATYKNPEYFCYHTTSFFDAEVELMKYRLPQPSNKSGKN